jgi:putative ABC transport system permease protein
VAMLTNYLKISLRLLVRNPFYAAINVIALSVGFTVFLVLWQYSRNELASDQQWRSSKQIARLGLLLEWSDNGENWESEKYGTTGSPFALQVMDDFPEIESFTRVLHRSKFTEQLAGIGKNIVLSYQTSWHNEISILEDKVVMADANLFEFFSIPLLKGESSLVLRNAHSAVVAGSIAAKYFGQEEPIGKIVTINSRSYVITGVFDDLPKNTHLDFEIVLSNADRISEWATAFGPPTVTSYVKFHLQPDLASFQHKLNQPKMIEKYYGQAMRIIEAKASTIVQPMSEVAFSEKWRGDQFIPKSKTLLTIFQLVGVLVMLMAFVNYMSLTIARIKRRQKEVATRRISGGGTSDFMRQFIIESALIIVISLISALTLLQLIKYPLLIYLQIPLFEIDLMSGIPVIALATLMIVLSAAYPTYLSRIPSIRNLFSKENQMRGNDRFQLSLTSLQLSIAVVLIIWAFMTYRQLTFILSNDLGFKKQDLITIDAPIFKSDSYESDIEVFRNRLRSMANVQNITLSNTVMGDEVRGTAAKRTSSDTHLGLDTNGGVDEYFIPFYGITLLAGRNFREGDRNSVIVSEGAVARLGFKSTEEAVGSTIEVERNFTGTYEWGKATIVGVVKSYRLRPMLRFSGDHDIKADAGIMLSYKDYLNANLRAERITIRADVEDIEMTMLKVGRLYSEIFPGNVFHWYFIDDHVNRHYKNENVLRNQIMLCTALAIGIACMGVLGMISNKASEKAKEIGIRRVLGADLDHVARVLLSTTAIQITLASLIGIPVSYFVTRRYLEHFSERIELHWWHFCLPVVLLTMIMLASVATMIAKAAQRNPVEALKHD